MLIEASSAVHQLERRADYTLVFSRLLHAVVRRLQDDLAELDAHGSGEGATENVHLCQGNACRRSLQREHLCERTVCNRRRQKLDMSVQ